MYCPCCRADYPDDWKVCPKDTTTLLKSAQIGKYAIEGLLGAGGMGAVYRAINPDTRGRVAIKVMHPADASAESARQRFQREAAAVAALRTAHVVKVYDFGSEADGTLYLVMELLDGHALRAEIRRGPHYMDLARVQLVMDGALKGLAAAHKAGIVHRDLKPENLYVADTDDGEVPKLLDFGIARVHTTDSNLTRTGHLMGTAAYMAPEQVAASPGDIGPWTDVYAMGAILYEMLAGAPAYSGASVTEVLSRVIAGDAVPLAALRPGLPDAVYALVARCTSADPAERPPDADAMRIALDGARLVPLGTPVPPHRTQAVTANRPGYDATAAPAGPTTTPARAQAPPVGVGAPTQATGVRAGVPPASVGAPTQATSAGVGTPTASVGAPTRPSAGAPGPLGSHGSSTSRSAPTAGPAATASRSAPAAAMAPVSRKRSRWPLAVLGVAAAATGAFFVVRSMRGATPAGPGDSVVVAVADAATPIDATVATATPDAPVIVDAAIASAPPDAAPKPRPKPPQPPPRPEPCDPGALQRQARDAMASGQDAAALAAAEKLAGCTSNDRAAANIAALAACRLGNAAKAKKYFPDVGPRRRGEIRNACARAGIQL